MKNVGAILKLTRFPLVFTAVADSAAGWLLAGGGAEPAKLGLLAGASSCLYACGMVLNDIADLPRDRTLHPERPLPSGQVSPAAAQAFGLALMFGAALFGVLLGGAAAQMVLGTAVLVVAYDFLLKRWRVPGALGMAAVRASNMMIGMLAAGAASWQPAAVLAGYVFFLTLMSTLEEGGGRKGLFAVCGLAMAAAPLALARNAHALIAGGALAGLLAVHTLVSLRSPDRAAVMRNVRWGVLGIIALDASFVMARDWRWGLGLLGLALPALALLPLFRRL